jgi:hypothetical protein
MDGRMNTDDIHKEGIDRFRDAWDADRANREAGLNDLEMLKGDQWPEQERQQREQDNRPFMTFNRLQQPVRQVTGDLRQNRPSVRVSPDDEGADEDAAKNIAGLIRKIERRSALRRPYLTAGISAARCGIGNFRILTRYTHNRSFNQDIYIEPIHNAFAVVWDHLARSATRDDARYCFVIERMAKEEFQARWPEAKVADFEEGDVGETEAEWFDSDTVRVCEYWYKEPVEKTLIETALGEAIILEDIEDEDERKIAKSLARRSRPIETHVVRMVKMSGLEVLEEAVEWPTEQIPIIAVTGDEIVMDDSVSREGVIRHAKDAQLSYNYFNTANVEFVALQPKQPYIAAIDQIAPFAEDWKNANAANRPVLPYKPVPNAPPPQRQTPALASQGAITAIQAAAEDIKATTGIYDAALGNRSNETSGKAILARQYESDVATFFIADNLGLAVQQCGRILVDLIPKVYDTQRAIRILHEDDSEETVTFNQPNMDQDGPERLNDLAVGRYDVDISTGPSFSTRRQEAAQSLMEFGNAYPEARAAVMDLVAKNMDWPGADEIAARLQKLLPPELQESDEEDMTPEEMQRRQAQAQAAQTAQQQQALEMAELAAKVEKLQSEAEQNRVETAEKQLDMAMQTGQFEQAVRAVVAAELSALMAQHSAAPAPGNGAFTP